MNKGTSVGGLQYLKILIIAALLAYLVAPALLPTHFEGISAMTEVAARLPSATFFNGSIAPPLVVEFVVASRPLMATLIRVFALVTGDIGTGFGFLITLSFAVFAAMSCLVARRLTGLPWVLLLLGFASFPGLTSLGYSLNDNVVSAAFGMSALAAVAVWPRAGGCLIAGLLLGIAICVRPDALLLAPAIALMAWQDEPGWRELAMRALLGAAGFVAVLLALPLLTGVNALDMITYVRFFAKNVPAAHHIVADLNAADIPMEGLIADVHRGGFWTKLLGASTNTLLFLGPSGLILLAISLGKSLGDFVRNRPGKIQWLGLRRFLLMYAYPLAIILYGFRYAIVIRYFFLFSAPFIIIFAASALDWLISVSKRGGAGKLACVAGIALVALATPPVKPRKAGGPEVFAGILWGPAVWLRYESGMREGMAWLTSSLAQGRGNETYIIANDWNEASYSLLAALRAGYHPVSKGPCANTAINLEGPDKTKLMVVSGYDPWDQALMPYRLNWAAQIDAAVLCHPEPPKRLIQAYLTSGPRHRVPAISDLEPRRSNSQFQPFAMPSQLPILVFDSTEIDTKGWQQFGETAKFNLHGENSQALIATMQSRLASRLEIPLAARQSR